VFPGEIAYFRVKGGRLQGCTQTWPRSAGFTTGTLPFYARPVAVNVFGRFTEVISSYSAPFSRARGRPWEISYHLTNAGVATL